jgi:predicted N-acetyltransferase YhbS
MTLQGSITIRKATDADVEGILQCLRIAFAPYQGSYTADAFRDTVLTPETIQERLSSMCVLVAVNETGGVVGTIACAMVNADEGHLRGMAVLPAYEGSGIAEKLLQAAEAELAAGRCWRITLDTTDPLLRAMRFYEKHGYRASGRTTDFFGMPLHEYVKDLRI